MMRIIHIVHSLQNGGLERTVLSLAASLADRGHRQWICCLRDAGVLARNVPSTIPVANLAACPHDGSLIRRLRRLFQNCRPDIVHTHNWGAWPEATLAAATLRGVKTVQTFHGFIEAMPLRRRLAARFLTRITGALTVVSNPLVREAARFCGLAPDRFLIIPNGVDCSYYRQDAIEDADLPVLGNGSVTTWCAAVGSLTPAKHPQNLLEAIRRLQAHIGAVWIGDGPLKETMAQMARQFGIAQRLRWVGYQPDVRPWIRQADIVVSSSRSEALPLNLLEAMAMGKPVVATRVGGVPRMITHGYDGITVPADNPVALARAIETLAADRTKQFLFGRRARERVIRDFSLSGMVDHYECLYDSLCRSRRSEPLRRSSEPGVQAMGRPSRIETRTTGLRAVLENRPAGKPDLVIPGGRP